MSQVFERFKHPPLYVFNFYPFYAPGEYKYVVILSYSDATHRDTQYSILI